MNIDGSSKLLASGVTNVEAAAVGGVMKRMDDTPITDNAHSGGTGIIKEGNNVPPNISPSVVEALASIAAANDGGDAAEQDSKKGPTEAIGGRGGTKDEFSARNDVISASVAEVPRVAAACTSDSGDDYDRKYHDLKEDAPGPHPQCATSRLVDDKAVNPTSVSAEASVGATGSSSAGYNTHYVDHEVQKHAPTPPQFFVAGGLEGGRDNDKSSHRTDPKRCSLDSTAAGGVGNSLGRNDEPQSQSRPIEEQSKLSQTKKRRKRPQRAGARPRGRREVHREDHHPPSSLVLQEDDPSAPQVNEVDAYLDEDQIGARLFAELNDYKTQASREREHHDFYYRYYWEAPSSSESEFDSEEAEAEEEASGDEIGRRINGRREPGTSPSADNDGGIGAAVYTEKPSIEGVRGAVECTNQEHSMLPSISTKAQPSDQRRRRSTRKASTVATTRIAAGGGRQQHQGSSSSSDKGGNKNGCKGKGGKKKNRRFTRRMARDLDQEIATLGLNALVSAMLEIEEEEGEGKEGTPRPVGDTMPHRLKRGRDSHCNAKGTSHSSYATSSASTSRKNNNATSKTAEGRRQRRGNKISKERTSTLAPRGVKPTTMLGRKRKHRVIEKEAKVDMDGKDNTKRRRRQVSISPPCWPPPSPEPRKRRKIRTPPKKESGTAGLFCGSSIVMAKEAKDRILAATFRTTTTADTHGCGDDALVARDGGPVTRPTRMKPPSAVTAMATNASGTSKSATPRRFLVALLKCEADNNGTRGEALGPLAPRDGDDAPARVRAAIAASDADSTHVPVAEEPFRDDKTKRPSTNSSRSPITARVTRIIVNGKSLLLPLEHDGRRCRRGKNMKSRPDAVVDSKSKVKPKKTQAQCASPESVAVGVAAKPPLFSEAPPGPTSPVLTPPSTPAYMAELHGKRTPYATHHPLWHTKLVHCMRSGGRRLARHEFFYSDIDRAWFKRNEYVIDLAKFGIPPNVKLTRSEWRAVRQLLPHRPKRFSPRFVSSQLKKLHCYRDQVRDVQKAAIAGATADLPYDRVLWGGSSKITQRVPMPIRVGTTVTAYSRQTQMIQRGIVMGRDYQRNTYIVQFDCKELGYEVCPDFEVSRQFQVSTIDRVKGALTVDCVDSNPIAGRPDMKKQAVADNEKRMCANMTSIGEASTPRPPTLSRGNHSVDSSTQPWTTLGSKDSSLPFKSDSKDERDPRVHLGGVKHPTVGWNSSVVVESILRAKCAV